MKKLLSIFLIVAGLLFIAPLISNEADAATRIKGYTKKNGAYVQPHFRSSPNRSKFDNWSTKGNYNPYTGKKGTVSPFKITPKKYR